jgi:hypothetical protein
MSSAMGTITRMAGADAQRGDVARTVELIPDQSITDAIGRGHTLVTAVSDILDNSLDARAENVWVRFVTQDDRVVAVRIRDDGTGMSLPELQGAMTLGLRRVRSAGALGHFGIGLKAASLSQAQTLTVYSRNSQDVPCAMRVRRGSFSGEVLEDSAAQEGYEWDARGPASTGTVVEWRELETVNQSELPAERRAWLERTITSLLQTLGLTFHRIINKGGIRITVDTWDTELRAAGLLRTVESRDPFQFNLSGHADYPAFIKSSMTDGTILEAECFILPPRSDSPAAWLLGRNPAEWQGIYVYRNDRLLQAGGWLGVRQDDKRLRLARMRIDVTDALERHLRLRHEKSGVTATPEFTRALEKATNDHGISLDQFRDAATEVYRASNARKQSVKPAVPVGHGLPDRVVEAVRNELGERDGESIRIEWKMLPEGRLFELQHDQQVIRFNLGYRAAIGGETASLVPTLVYLLLEGNFTKSRLNQVTKDQIDAWQAIASAALLADRGDESYDALANWPRAEPARSSAPRPGIMAGPRPAPPSFELRWAHLGQRGETQPGAYQEFLETQGSTDMQDPLRPAAPIKTEMPTARDSPTAAIQDLLGAEIHELEEASRDSTLPTRRKDLPLIAAIAGDKEIVVMYRARADIEVIAATLALEPREVAMRLSELVLDLRGDDIDDHHLAAMHGMPYSPEERERIVHLFRDGKDARWIAAHYSRTPFAIAWQLLTSPKRPVEVPKNLLRRIDRALTGAPSQDASERPFAG